MKERKLLKEETAEVDVGMSEGEETGEVDLGMSERRGNWRSRFGDE